MMKGPLLRLLSTYSVWCGSVFHGPARFFEHSSAHKDFSNNCSILKKCKANLTAWCLKCFLLMNLDLVSMYNLTQFMQKFLNSSFNEILLLFFFCMLYFILLHFQTFFIVPNIFLHLTHIYANSFNFLLT